MKHTIDARPVSIQYTDENGELRLEADISGDDPPEIGMSIYDGRRAVEIYLSPDDALRLSAWLAARGIEISERSSGSRAPA